MSPKYFLCVKITSFHHVYPSSNFKLKHPEYYHVSPYTSLCVESVTKHSSFSMTEAKICQRKKNNKQTNKQKTGALTIFGGGENPNFPTM